MQIDVLQIPILTLNRGKAARLEAMRTTYTECVRFHLAYIDRTGETNGTAVHHACYRESRNRFQLPAATTQQAREKAIQAYRAFQSRRRRDRRARPPTFRRALPLRIATDNLRIFPDRGVIRVSTLDGFLWLPIQVPEAFRDSIKLPHGASEIVRKGDRYYLMLVVKREDVPAREGGPHFGIDLGLANVAVLAGPGVVEFFDGKPLRHVRGRWHRYRKALQEKRKTGMVKRSKGRESRWATDMNHKVSRKIVDVVAAHGGTLHVERLKGIRERAKGTAKVRRMLHSWPFAQLLSFISYKAAMAGVPVIEEDPRHTSQRCSRCGHTERGNRTKQADFACKRCGYRCHADLNAARNLAAKGACPLGEGGVTPPVPDSSGRSGEAMLARKDRHRGNHDLASS